MLRGLKNINTPGKPPERKDRVVTDIRGLNKISMFDAYPMTLQTDVIAAVLECPYISVMDCASFFHQWLVQLADRHKLTIVSHRGWEQWNVAVMGYRNSQAYVQRQIDRLLYEYRHFAKAYVDDVVVFSQSLEEHLRIGFSSSFPCSSFDYNHCYKHTQYYYHNNYTLWIRKNCTTRNSRLVNLVKLVNVWCCKHLICFRFRGDLSRKDTHPWHSLDHLTTLMRSCRFAGGEQEDHGHGIFRLHQEGQQSEDCGKG